MKTLAAETWLILRNDLRLYWAELLSARWRSAGRVALILILFLVANVVTVLGFKLTGYQPSERAETLAWLFFLTLMAGTAVNHAITVLFTRGDFDLLLSSPISSRAVLLARMAILVVGALGTVAIFAVPLVNGVAVGVSARYAWAYVAWLATGVLVASGSLWLAVVAVRSIGARRARTFVQIGGAILGAAVYLGMQLYNQLSAAQQLVLDRVLTALAHHPPVSWLVHGARGEAAPLLAVVAAAALALPLTARMLGRMFISGVQESTTVRSTRQQRLTPYAFAEGAVYVTFRKDLRLIARDPLLLGKMLPSMMYWLPVVFLIGKDSLPAGLGALAVAVAAQFSADLSEVATAGEECWDLIAMSPTAEVKLRLGKLIAGMALPVVTAVLLCGVAAAMGRPWLGLTAAAMSVIASAGCGWLEVADVEPTPRHDLIARRRTGWRPRRLVVGLILLTGAGGIALAGASHVAFGAVALGVSTLIVIACFVLVDVRPVTLRAARGG